MDTMEVTKIAGGLCGALLVYLLVNWAGEIIYHVEAAEAHGEDDGDDHGKSAKSAYFIEVAEATSTGTEEAGPSFAELLASADVDRGAKVFAKCKACHKVEDGANGTGPHLFNVVDRAIAAIDGFNYSGALAGKGGNWDVDSLNAFLTRPKDFAPGTTMGFAGLKKETDRANLIGYLATIK